MIRVIFFAHTTLSGSADNVHKSVINLLWTLFRVAKLGREDEPSTINEAHYENLNLANHLI